MSSYGLLGQKLAHSYSKVIHESIMDYQYDLIEKQPEQLADFFQQKQFQAINVTVPYKQQVIPYLDYLDERAQAIGAVNTVVNRQGKLYGYNTDFDGVVGLLQHHQIDIQNRVVAILGTGGTSRTITAVCRSLKAKKIYIVSRQPLDEKTLSYQEVYQHPEIQVIFNTTPCGMYPHNQDCPMSLEGLENLQALVDVIYNPFETLLVQQAKRLGVKAVGGFYMLVAQAVKAMELFKDVSLDEAVIDQVYQKLYQEKQNIVLTGMPGCGKSTIGKLLAQKLNRQFVDTDDYIEKQAGKSIKEIFQQQKESGFRELETQACQTLGKQQSLVLSTGGGAILKEENIEACRQNGKIFYIARAVEKLDVNDQRPLSQSLLDNQKLFEKRKELYQATADYIIDNDGDINRTLEQIWAIIHEDFSHERT